MFNFFKKGNKKGKRVSRVMGEGEITMDELQMKQIYGAKIVDIRSKQEYDEGHINGSINIPEYEINKNIEKTLKDKNVEIVVYCNSGNRSKKAYNKLKKLGYKNVFDLYGGLEEWG